MENLWDSVDESLPALPTPKWHRQALDEILNKDERNPQHTVNWRDLRSELAQKWAV